MIKNYLFDRMGQKLWVALLIVAATCYFGYFGGWWPGVFWDNMVYSRSVADHLAGLDAYRNEPPPFLPFVYHPYILKALVAVNAVFPLSYALVFALFTLVIYVVILLFRVSSLSRREFITAMAVVAPLKFFVITSFASANLVVTLNFLIFSVCLKQLTEEGRFLGRLPFFLVVVAALVKPYLLAYLCLTLLDRRPIWHSILIILGGSALAMIVWFSGYSTMPSEMSALTANLLDLQSPARIDLGFSIYAELFKLTGSNLIALGIHTLVMGGLAFWVLTVLWNARDQGTARPELILVIGWLVLTLINPRMKDYDIGPALFFLTPIVWPVAPRFRAITTAWVTFLLVPLVILVGAALMGIRI